MNMITRICYYGTSYIKIVCQFYFLYFYKTKSTKDFIYPIPLFFQQFRLTGAINKSDDRRELPTIPQPTHTVSSSQSYNEIDIYVAQTKYYIDHNWS